MVLCSLGGVLSDLTALVDLNWSHLTERVNCRSTCFLNGDAHHYRAAQPVFALFYCVKFWGANGSHNSLVDYWNQLDVFLCIYLPKWFCKSSIYEMYDVLKLEKNGSFIYLRYSSTCWELFNLHDWTLLHPDMQCNCFWGIFEGLKQPDEFMSYVLIILSSLSLRVWDMED